MHTDKLAQIARAACALIAVLAFAACGSSAGAAWTYAPLGPTPVAAASPSPGGSPAGSAAGSPSGPVLSVETTDANSLAFDPNSLDAPANTAVTVNYNNNSALPHNIKFFNGPDQNAPSLAASEIVTGPNALESVTFTTPATPGDYFFWCDVHTTGMTGTLHVQ
jgi:plastocyanin